jgi:hypothetical protein
MGWANAQWIGCESRSQLLKAGLKTRLYFSLMTTSEISSSGLPNATTSFLIAS